MPADLIQRQSYKTPPIVEAVVDIRFAEDVTSQRLLEALESAVKGAYGGTRLRQFKVSVSAELSPESVSAKATQAVRAHLLRSEDGLRVIGCGDRTLSMHVLAPYPGWEAFAAQAVEAVDALPDELRAIPLESLAVRYIDRIVLPNDVSPDDFFSILPARPSRLPPVLGAIHLALQTMDSEGGTLAMLTVASAEPEDADSYVMIYDIHVTHRFASVFTLQGNAWRDVAEDLHKRQRDIFEESITDKMRERFQ